jgi:hypothetical protein
MGCIVNDLSGRFVYEMSGRRIFPRPLILQPQNEGGWGVGMASPPESVNEELNTAFLRYLTQTSHTTYRAPD